MTVRYRAHRLSFAIPAVALAIAPTIGTGGSLVAHTIIGGTC